MIPGMSIGRYSRMISLNAFPAGDGSHASR